MEKLTNEKRKDHPYYKNDHQFQHRMKKYDTKQKIKTKQEELLEWIKNIDPKATEGKTEDEIKEYQKQQGDELRKRRAEISVLQDELKALYANKRGSTAFEISYTPPNRRMRKLLRKQRQ